MSVSPFFIVGCGRSGSSLLRSMLIRHEAIAIPLESLFIIDYLRVSKRIDLAQLKAMLVSEPEIREWGLDLTLKDIEGSQTIEQAIEVIQELYAESQGKSSWGQKTPRFVRHTELLEKYFPQARFVHLIRDPRAVASSLILSDVHRSNAYHASLRWKTDVGAGLSFQEENPEKVISVHYEDLVKNTEQSLQNITFFLGLKYDPAMIQHENEPAEYSDFYANIHANLQRAPSEEFIDRWKNQLSDNQLRVVETITGEMMEALGYPRLVPNAKSRPLYELLLRSSRVSGLPRQTWRYLRYRRAYLRYLLWRKWKLGLLGEFLRGMNY